MGYFYTVGMHINVNFIVTGFNCSTCVGVLSSRCDGNVSSSVYVNCLCLNLNWIFRRGRKGFQNWGLK